MSRLNYHHLHYFWAIAKEGNLTRAAARLHVSQSALSTQLRQLEEQVGQPLFTRTGRTLQLTEAGRLALSYAESIFSAGDELIARLRDEQRPARQLLRIGAVATLSRNFQENFLRPLLARDDVELQLHSGALEDLLGRLRVHSLDLVLSNRAVQPGSEEGWRCRRIARQPVSLIGHPRPRRQPFRFPQDLATVPLVLPSRATDIRLGFDLLCEQYGIRYRLLAEVDDMPLMRLLTRDARVVALMPSVVVQDELRLRKLAEYHVVDDLHENFFAVTVRRHAESALLRSLLVRPEGEVLTGAG